MRVKVSPSVIAPYPSVKYPTQLREIDGFQPASLLKFCGKKSHTREGGPPMAEPERSARETIDKLLQAAGWRVQGVGNGVVEEVA
jgi:hypothetical protein